MHMNSGASEKLSRRDALPRYFSLIPLVSGKFLIFTDTWKKYFLKKSTFCLAPDTANLHSNTSTPEGTCSGRL